MGERTSYPPGTFSWAELMTSDADAAKAFYTKLFGWDYDDTPTGPDGPVYSMAQRDGHQVAALFGDDSEPPHWNCYVTVESVDEAAQKATDSGGTVMARGVRRDGGRAHGGDRRSHRRGPLPVGAAHQHRRHAREHAPGR